MRRKSHRLAATLLAVASGAVMLVSPNFACESFLGETAMSSLDFCFIFDCNSGLLGGTVQPCGVGVDAEGNEVPNYLFVDCPVPGE